MAAFGSNFTLTEQAAFGSDFDFDANGSIGIASVSIVNEVYAVGTASVSIENDVFDGAIGVAGVSVENEVYAVGTASLDIEHEVYALGAVGVSVENDVYAIGVASINIANGLYALGTASLALTHHIYALGTASVSIENEITPAGVGVAGVNIVNDVYAVGTASVSIEHRVNDYAAAKTANVWAANIILGGVDMSTRVVGTAVIDGAEGAARIAEFTLAPFSGVIDPYDWVNDPVVIDFAQYDALGNVAATDRLFTGKVNEPVYDPITKLMSFTCTDALQEYLEQRPKSAIDSMLGGNHSTDVFGETDDHWAYAQQRMSTQAASFDFDVNGIGRKTGWGINAGGSALDESDVIHDSLGMSLISRRDVLNTVNINIGYRYARKWQRELSGGWQYPRPFYQYLSESTTLPNRAMVLSALDTGWDIKSINWQKLPASGQYTDSEGSQTTWGITDSLRESLVFGLHFSVAKRWLQDITETYDIRVVSPASVDKHGELAVAASYSIDVEVDEEYEAPAETSSIRITQQTDDSETGTSFGYKEPEPGSTLINDYDSILDPENRADFDNAVNTAVAEAETRILASHRANTVVVDTLINPQADNNQEVAINCLGVVTGGKIKRVRHTLSFDDGYAYTTIEAAIYQPNVANQTSDTLPTLAVDASPNVTPHGITLNSYFGGKELKAYDPDWTGYIGNWANREYPSDLYTEEFRIDLPAVETEARDAVEFNLAHVHNVSIPINQLTITN